MKNRNRDICEQTRIELIEHGRKSEEFSEHFEECRQCGVFLKNFELLNAKLETVESRTPPVALSENTLKQSLSRMRAMRRAQIRILPYLRSLKQKMLSVDPAIPVSAFAILTTILFLAQFSVSASTAEVSKPPGFSTIISMTVLMQNALMLLISPILIVKRRRKNG